MSLQQHIWMATSCRQGSYPCQVIKKASPANNRQIDKCFLLPELLPLFPSCCCVPTGPCADSPLRGGGLSLASLCLGETRLCSYPHPEYPSVPASMLRAANEFQHKIKVKKYLSAHKTCTMQTLK